MAPDLDDLDPRLESWLADWALETGVLWSANLCAEPYVQALASAARWAGPLPLVTITNKQGAGGLAGRALPSGRILLLRGEGEQGAVFIHELTHAAGVSGHGAAFAAACWALSRRVGLAPERAFSYERLAYDLGRSSLNDRSYDTPASDADARWALRWSIRHARREKSAQALAGRAIRDWRRRCHLQALVAAAIPFLRLAVALAAATGAPALLAHMI